MPHLCHRILKNKAVFPLLQIADRKSVATLLDFAKMNAQSARTNAPFVRADWAFVRTNGAFRIA